MNDFGTNDMFLIVGHDCEGVCSVVDVLECFDSVIVGQCWGRFVGLWWGWRKKE